MSESTRWNIFMELLSNYIHLLFRCVRWRPGHLATEPYRRTFYISERGGDLRKMKYNRSLPVHVKTKWKLKFISAIHYTSIFYFSTFFTLSPPPFTQLKHFCYLEIFSIYSWMSSIPAVTVSMEEDARWWGTRRNENLLSMNAINMNRELSVVLKWFSTVAAAEGGLRGRLGLITIFCREYRP